MNKGQGHDPSQGQYFFLNGRHNPTITKKPELKRKELSYEEFKKMPKTIYTFNGKIHDDIEKCPICGRKDTIGNKARSCCSSWTAATTRNCGRHRWRPRDMFGGGKQIQPLVMLDDKWNPIKSTK